jgi:ClpX C4-type zinc finger
VSFVRPVAFGGGAPSRKRCSFCGRRDEAVEHLVRARGGTYICDRCVAQAHEAIATAPLDERMLRIRPTPAQVADRDSAELAVELAFETLFNPDLPIPERYAAIASGANLATAMQQVNDRYPARDVDVSVSYVRFLSEDEAEVHFVVFVPHFGASGMARTGHAVLVGQEWKVSRDTWCDLVRMAGVECPPPEERPSQAP